MTKEERDYLYINYPDMLREIDRGSSSARMWFNANWSAISSALHNGCGPTRDQVETQRRQDRENEGAAGW